ncbi:NAD(P)-dependent oxidoreductase [Nonomuraea thailandensis]
MGGRTDRPPVSGVVEAAVSRIVVFGAGGRAGTRVVAEAAGRGHEVTAVVRDPGRHPELGGAGVKVVTGDVTDGGSVAAVAAGHDVALQVAARLDLPSEEFYAAATRALVDGLGRAGVPRLVALGIGSLLEVSPACGSSTLPVSRPRRGRSRWGTRPSWSCWRRRRSTGW